MRPSRFIATALIGAALTAPGCKEDVPKYNVIVRNPEPHGMLHITGDYKDLGIDNNCTLGTPDIHPGEGFSYYDNHRGGTGNTLQIMSNEKAVYMMWAFQSLNNISVRQGWNGETDNGLKIGDDFQKFRALYPVAEKRKVRKDYDNGMDEIWTDRMIKFSFREGKINGIEINPHIRNDDVYPVGPSSGSSPWWKDTGNDPTELLYLIEFFEDGKLVDTGVVRIR